MPFQLYPQLPAGASNDGIVKDELFGNLFAARVASGEAPAMTEEQRLQRVVPLSAAWAAEGLKLSSPPTGLNANGGGRMGSSFDAQRLILLARSQGCEDRMIEEIYYANHTNDECLSDWSVLLRCARKAGVKDAEGALRSGWGVSETINKINEYRAMGVTAVPVVVIDSLDDLPIKGVLSSGAPETDFLREVFAHLLQYGRLPWSADKKPMPSPQPKGNWQPNHLSQPQPSSGGGGGGGCANTCRKPIGPPVESPSSKKKEEEEGGGSGEAKKAEVNGGGGAMSRIQSMLSGGGSKSSGGGGGSSAAKGFDVSPLKTAIGACDENIKCTNGRCDAPLTLKDCRAVKNVLSGSKRPSTERPHFLSIDADFVTCTQ